MDIISITDSSLPMRAEQTRQSLSTTMIKQAATQQNQVADMLAQNIRQATQTVAKSDNDFGFSIYA